MSEVAAPDHLDAMVAWVRDRAAASEPFAIRGGGTRSRAVAADCLVTTGLRGTRFFEPADMVVGVEAGMPFADLQSMLTEQGMRLPVNPWFEGATVGGVVAANDDGPERLDGGGIRDFIIGMECINVAGQLVKSGGKVVKNVSGYDVGRMMCGSLGGLAVMTAVHFKVMPAPIDPRTMIVQSKDAGWCAPLLDGVHLAALPLTWALAVHDGDCGWRLGLGFAGNTARRARIEQDLRSAFAALEIAAFTDSDTPETWAAFGPVARDRGFLSPWVEGWGDDWCHLYVSVDTATCTDANLLANLAGVCDRLLVFPIGGGIHCLFRDASDIEARINTVGGALRDRAAWTWFNRVPESVIHRLGQERLRPAGWRWMQRLKAGLDPAGLLLAPFYEDQS